MSKFEVSIFLATIIGGMLYALRNQNVKQMIWLYPEEKDKPISSRIFLHSYRIFMLIVIPGLPVYLLLLKLTGVINWSWWLIVLPVLLIYTPILFLMAPFKPRAEEDGDSLERPVVIDSNHDNSGNAHAKNRRILAINDNPRNIEDWRQLFEESSYADIGFEIDSAGQGQEGLQKIRQAFQEGFPYVVAFVDVRMPPGWDGVMTIERIWAEYPDFPVIIHAPYSDYSAPEIIERLGTSEKLLIFKYPPDNEAIHQFVLGITNEWEYKQAKQFEQVLMRAAKLPWAGILDPDWIRKLAENGDVRCMFYLGTLYLYGREGFLNEQSGFQQDRNQAIRWLREAARLGNQDAKDKLVEIGEMVVTNNEQAI